MYIWFINHTFYIGVAFTPLISWILSKVRSHASYSNNNNNNNTSTGWFSSYLSNYYTKPSNTQTSFTGDGSDDGNEDDDWNNKFTNDNLKKLHKNALLKLYNETLGYYQQVLDSIRISVNYSRTHGLTEDVLQGLRVNL